MFVDSHCHLNLLDLSKLKLSLSDVIQHSINNKVNNILSVATHPLEHQALTNIARNFPMVKVSVGMHPEHVLELKQYNLTENLLPLAIEQAVVAIGETGLDYYHISKMQESDFIQHQKSQKAAFVEQIFIAKKVKKPLIVHTRMAQQDTIDILTNEQAYLASGVMHCFTENWDVAKKALDLGFYISFSGIITFNSKVADLLEVVKKVPIERILIETDSPYLAPVPYRGKINQPAYVVYVAQKIAELKNTSLEKVAEITTANYKSLFNIN